MKATLNQEAMRMATIANDTGPSSALNCVKIGNGEVIATDGFMLARKPIETEGKEEILVRASNILKAKKAGGRKLEKIFVNTDEMTITDKDGKVDASFSHLQISYPPISQLYPTGKQEAFIAINAKLLAKLIKVVGTEAIIEFKIRGTKEPVEFAAGNVSGLIMPYATEKSEHWHKEKK